MKVKTLIVGTVGVIWFCIGCQASVLAEAQQNALIQAKKKVPSVKEFVERLYPRGVPYAEADKYAGGDPSEVKKRVGELLNMLDDKSKRSYRSNIIVTLGIIGHPTVVDSMTKFVGTSYENSDQKSIDWPEVRAKRSALIALGYVINRIRNKDDKDITNQGKEAANAAVRFLCGRLGQKNPCALTKESKLEATDRMHRKDIDLKSKVKTDTLNPYLRPAAILGLALSGSAEGDAALRTLEKAAGKEFKKGFTEKMGEFFTFLHREASDFFPFSEEVENALISKEKPSKKLRKPRVVAPLNEARSAHEVIRKQGLRCYYNRKDPGCKKMNGGLVIDR